MRKNKTKPTAKHFQMTWDVFNAVEVVEQYEKETGDTSGQMPYMWLRKIYKGNLFDELQFGTLKNHQIYGVTFKSDIELQDGSRGIVERGFKLSEKMKLSELINGYEDCYVNHCHGLQTKGWKGAMKVWLKMMDEEFGGAICHSATAVANCLAKV